MLHILVSKSKMLRESVSSLAGITPQSRLSTAPTFDSVSKFSLHETDILFARKAFMREFEFFFPVQFLSSAKSVFQF